MLSRAVCLLTTCAGAVGLVLAVAGFSASAWFVLLALLSGCLLLILRRTRRLYGTLGLWQASTVAVGFFALTFVARPIQLLWRGGDRSTWTVGAELLPAGARALLAVVLFLACALAAYAVFGRRAPVEAPVPSWPRARLRLALVASAAISVAGIAAVAYLEEGFGPLLANTFGRRQALAGRFYLVGLSRFLTGCLLFVVADVATRRTSRRAIVWPAALAAALVLPLGGRGEFIVLGLSMLAVWQAFGRRIAFRWAPVLWVAAVTVISLGLGLRLLSAPDPRQGRTTVARVSLDPRQALPQLVEDGFTGFDRLLFVLPRIPSEVPFQTWTTYNRLLAAPVPRSVWPEKPGLSEATVTAPLFGTSVGRFPISAVGEAWLQAGYLGLVVVGSFVGWLWALLGRLVAGAGRATTRVVAVVASLALFSGPSNLALIDLGLRCLPLLLLSVVLRTPSGRSSTADSNAVSHSASSHSR